MAKKKKKAPVRRKKLQRRPVESEDGPTELDGWKVGDNPWAVPFGSNKPEMLQVEKVNPNDSVPSLSCFNVTTRRFCVVATSWCADNKKDARQLYLSRSKDTT